MCWLICKKKKKGRKARVGLLVQPIDGISVAFLLRWSPSNAADDKEVTFEALFLTKTWSRLRSDETGAVLIGHSSALFPGFPPCPRVLAPVYSE